MDTLILTGSLALISFGFAIMGFVADRLTGD